jgi:hypothetical protein
MNINATAYRLSCELDRLILANDTSAEGKAELEAKRRELYRAPGE